MSLSKMLQIGSLCLLTVPLSGCAWGMFNYVEQNVEYRRTTTIGQELKDLQEARDANAISEQEYEKKKKEILSEEFYPMPLIDLDD